MHVRYSGTGAAWDVQWGVSALCRPEGARARASTHARGTAPCHICFRKAARAAHGCASRPRRRARLVPPAGQARGGRGGCGGGDRSARCPPVLSPERSPSGPAARRKLSSIAIRHHHLQVRVQLRARSAHPPAPAGHGAARHPLREAARRPGWGVVGGRLERVSHQGLSLPTTRRAHTHTHAATRHASRRGSKPTIRRLVMPSLQLAAAAWLRAGRGTSCTARQQRWYHMPHGTSEGRDADAVVGSGLSIIDHVRGRAP